MVTHLPIRMSAVLALAVLSVAGCCRPTADLTTELEPVIRQNFEMCQKKDLEGTMKTVHSKSPVYAQTVEVLDKLFASYELKYELASCHFIGSDGTYAVARVTQKTTRVSGPEFPNSVLDSIYVFRQENGKWKLWQTAVLESPPAE
jgi:hypothetical protein